MMVPPKVAYAQFENDDELEFEFYLAQKLGMTVEAMRDNMSNAEFVRWGIYYARKAQRQEIAMKG
jgi:hypothetical protein